MDCPEARRALQERMDIALPAEWEEGLEDHLRICPRCRRIEADLHAMREALRALPVRPLPEKSLARVWAATVGAPAAPRPRPSLRRWWGAGIAAALAFAGLSALAVLLCPPAPTSPTPEELAQAADETRLVLALTGRALERSERAAVGDVLAEEVSPALQQVPIAWGPPPEPNRSVQP